MRVGDYVLGIGAGLVVGGIWQEDAMRIGDYVLGISMALNVAAGVAYAWQGHWRNVGYWFAVLQINYWLMQMR